MVKLLETESIRASQPRSSGVCVVLPTRREPAPSVIALLEQIDSWCRPDGVVIVDDSDEEYGRGFSDEVRRAFPAADVHVRTGAERTGGLGGAVLAGLTRAQQAGHTYAVVLDADGQHPAAAVPRLIAALSGPEYPDIVVASRYTGDGGVGDGFSRSRALISRTATRVSRLAFPAALGRCTDPMSGFFAVRLAALQLDGCFADGFKVLMQVMCQHPGLRFAEVSLRVRIARGRHEQGQRVRRAPVPDRSRPAAPGRPSFGARAHCCPVAAGIRPGPRAVPAPLSGGRRSRRPRSRTRAALRRAAPGPRRQSWPCPAPVYGLSRERARARAGAHYHPPRTPCSARTGTRGSAPTSVSRRGSGWAGSRPRTGAARCRTSCGTSGGCTSSPRPRTSSLPAAIVDAGPTGTSFVMVTDRTTGNVIADASRPGAVRPLVGLNDRPEEGFRAHYYTPGTTVTMRGDAGRLRTTARIHRFPFVPRVSQPWIDLELELATAAQPGVTAIVDLHTVPPSVTTTAKKAGLLTSGRLVVRDRGGQSARWELSDGYGGFDFTSGHLPRETSWRWAYGTGRTSTGRTAGVNLTCGFTGMEDRASENSLWLDGRIIPLDPAARIDCDTADLMAPWQIKTLDGATDLAFHPMGLHRENLNLGVVRSYFVQAQGHITGTIRAGAEVLTLDRFPAVTEDQRVLW